MAGQQCLQPACLQGGAAETGESPWSAYSYRARSTVLLQTQPDPELVVGTRHAALPRRGFSIGAT